MKSTLVIFLLLVSVAILLQVSEAFPRPRHILRQFSLNKGVGLFAPRLQCVGGHRFFRICKPVFK